MPTITSIDELLIYFKAFKKESQEKPLEKIDFNFGFEQKIRQAQEILGNKTEQIDETKKTELISLVAYGMNIFKDKLEFIRVPALFSTKKQSLKDAICKHIRSTSELLLFFIALPLPARDELLKVVLSDGVMLKLVARDSADLAILKKFLNDWPETLQFTYQIHSCSYAIKTNPLISNLYKFDNLEEVANFIDEEQVRITKELLDADPVVKEARQLSSEYQKCQSMNTEIPRETSRILEKLNEVKSATLDVNGFSKEDCEQVVNDAEKELLAILKHIPTLLAGLSHAVYEVSYAKKDQSISEEIKTLAENNKRLETLAIEFGSHSSGISPIESMKEALTICKKQSEILNRRIKLISGSMPTVEGVDKHFTLDKFETAIKNLHETFVEVGFSKLAELISTSGVTTASDTLHRRLTTNYANTKKGLITLRQEVEGFRIALQNDLGRLDIARKQYKELFDKLKEEYSDDNIMQMAAFLEPLIDYSWSGETVRMIDEQMDKQKGTHMMERFLKGSAYAFPLKDPFNFIETSRKIFPDDARDNLYLGWNELYDEAMNAATYLKNKGVNLDAFGKPLVDSVRKQLEAHRVVRGLIERLYFAGDNEINELALEAVKKAHDKDKFVADLLDAESKGLFRENGAPKMFLMEALKATDLSKVLKSLIDKKNQYVLDIQLVIMPAPLFFGGVGESLVLGQEENASSDERNDFRGNDFFSKHVDLGRIKNKILKIAGEGGELEGVDELWNGLSVEHKLSIYKMLFTEPLVPISLIKKLLRSSASKGEVQFFEKCGLEMKDVVRSNEKLKTAQKDNLIKCIDDETQAAKQTRTGNETVEMRSAVSRK